MLELGLPLDLEDSPAILPRVPGFQEPDAWLLAVVISHPHMDHYGRVRHLQPGVPLVIGESAARILNAAAQFIRDAPTFDPIQTLHDRRTLRLGPFTITPYLVDHAAYDAYGMVVEAQGKRIYYSGDFRAHGRKSALFERMLRESPRDIDVLLMEGSTLGRDGTEVGFPTEAELEAALVAAGADSTGMLLVYASAQNIDRIVTLFRACKRMGRLLIIDVYAAAVLAATGNARIPQSDWPGVRVFIPERQRRWIARNELFDELARHKANRIFPEHLAGMAPQAAMEFRDSMTEDMERAACTTGARFVYSMWGGYLQQPRMQGLLQWLGTHDIPLQHIHTPDSAPEDARPLLNAAQSKMGFLPNLLAKLAEAPAALEAYLTLSGIYDGTSFAPGERQLILLATAVENACEFCVAAHSAGARRAKVEPSVVAAVREGKRVPDDRLRALVEFTQAVVIERGWVGDAAVQAFLDAGFTAQQVLEVLIGVTLKTLSNYANHIVGTPLNPELAGEQWTAQGSGASHAHRHAV